MFEVFVGSKIDFMSKRRLAYILSLVLVLAGVGSLIVHGGPKESIDFTGGTLLDVRFNQVVDVADVRAAASAGGFEGAEIQMVDDEKDALLRIKPENSPENAFSAFQTAFTEANSGTTVELRRTETVGPKVGDELEKKAAGAILWSLVLILIYIAWRFTRISFGVAAVLALFHDILITLGVFSILNIDVSLTVVAAFLTIGGYSINDTIVLFDRIRENRGMQKRRSFSEVVNISVNQTLSRTMLTSLTTLVAVICLFIFGGIVIRDFALAMMIGVVVGTYSSVFVASSIAVDLNSWWERRKAKKAAEGKSKAGTKKLKKPATAN